MQLDAQDSAQAGQALPSTAARWQRLARWVDRLSPWASLVLSVVSAGSMDRGQEQGSLIAIAAALGFVALVVVTLAHRPSQQTAAPKTGRWHKVFKFAAASTSQSLLQTSLFFAGPFYLQAAAFTVPQCAFLAAFAGAAVVCSWDPWCLRALLHPVFGPALLSFSSFVAWNVALPMLGVPHALALWISAGAVSFSVPLVQLSSGAHRGRRLRMALAGALVPLGLAAFCVRALPAAPLSVVVAGIGTAVEERTLVGGAARFPVAPPRLTCFTAVFAPRGMSDQLLHVWTHDGAPLSRISLTVKGGRKAGYRTWSKQPLYPSARGRYRCEVQTPLGQTLSVTEVVIGAEPR